MLCVLNPGKSGGQDYDAVIKDMSTSPPSTAYVQLTTTTFNRDEYRRMKYFLQHGRVSVFGKVEGLGHVENEFVSHEELLERAFESIATAATRKASFSYGPGYVLVIAFDDFMWFGTNEDRERLRAFVDARLPSWRLNVETFYVLGISGRTLLSFPSRRRQH